MYKKHLPDLVRYPSKDRKIQFIQAASEQEQNERQVDKSKAEPSPKTEEVQRKTNVAEKGQKIKKELDKIIDEIDDVLEENAEEFIRSYVQRGGE